MQAHLFLVVFYQSLTLDYYNVNVFILQWFTSSHAYTDIVNVFYDVPLASAYFTLSIRPYAYTKRYTHYGAVMQQLHVSRFARVHIDHIYGPILGAERLPYRVYKSSTHVVVWHSEQAMFRLQGDKSKKNVGRILI